MTTTSDEVKKTLHEIIYLPTIQRIIKIYISTYI